MARPFPQHPQHHRREGIISKEAASGCALLFQAKSLVVSASIQIAGWFVIPCAASRLNTLLYACPDSTTRSERRSPAISDVAVLVMLTS